MPLDVTQFKQTTNQVITNKTDPSSITPPNVGGQINALADLMAQYINENTSGTEKLNYSEEDFDGDGYLHVDGNPPTPGKDILSGYVNGEPVTGLLYYPNEQKVGGLGAWFNPESQPDLDIKITFI